MSDFFKNIEATHPMYLRNQVEYQPGQVVSKTLAQNSAFGLTLFAITKGEGISAHTSKGDALVLILEGKAQIQIDDSTFTLAEQECIVMPAGHPHSVSAIENFKFLLIVNFA